MYENFHPSFIDLISREDPWILKLAEKITNVAMTEGSKTGNIWPTSEICFRSDDFMVAMTGLTNIKGFYIKS